MTTATKGPANSGWSALPRLVTIAPPAIVIPVGVAVVVLGLLIVVRPLTSLMLLGVYVGVSAIISGIVDLAAASRHSTVRWWNWLLSGLWIAGGIAVLIWLSQGLQLLPTVLAWLLIIGGAGSFAGEATGRVSQRVLAACWGGTQIMFGVLSLSRPDVTVLVVAVIFGVRTMVFGAVLLVRGGRAVGGVRSFV